MLVRYTTTQRHYAGICTGKIHHYHLFIHKLNGGNKLNYFQSIQVVKKDYYYFIGYSQEINSQCLMLYANLT